MAVLGIRKTTWNGLPVRDREIMRAIGFELDLGVPAEWVQPPNTGWYLFCDTRFTLAELASVSYTHLTLPTILLV